eukprot:scaffold2657_cov89-Amphora_coffeaeformis.AAC.23
MFNLLASALLLLVWSLITGNNLTGASSDLSFLQHNSNEQNEHLLHTLHRKLPTGRNKPTADEMAAFQAEEKAAKHGSLRASAHQRDLQVSDWVCKQVLDGYLGTSGVERNACQTCRKDPNDPAQYIIECDFTDYCSFCAHDDPAGPDACYTLTHEYTVRPWNGKFKWIEDIAYSACGIYHDTGRKACLDETYVDWGYLNTRCVSVDDKSCRVCEKSKNCKGSSNYFYDCGNIEAGFVMDDCDYSINDDIGKDSVFVGFNYGMYAKDTDTCFDDSKSYLGNLGGTLSPVASPTDSPTPSPTSSPTRSPTDTPTGSPTDSPVEKEPEIFVDPTPAQTGGLDLVKRNFDTITVRIKNPKNAGGVTEEVLQTALKEALLSDLNAEFSSLKYVELRGQNEGSAAGNRLLKKRVIFKFSGEAYFSNDSPPSQKQVFNAEVKTLSSLTKVDAWNVRAGVQSNRREKRAAKKKACKERGGTWKRKKCILP